MTHTRHLPVYLLFTIVIALNIALWLGLREVKAVWLNVPPAPSEHTASAFMLGDDQMAYRVMALTVQNLGDSGGRVTALHDYDYNELAKWFWLSDKFDRESEFMPMLAAYYFGAVDDPEKLRPLALYLNEVGSRPEGEKWRWKAQAIYIARYKLKDLDLAYRWAQELAADPRDLPAWTKQMPAFIQNAEGDKQAAYDIMVEILKTGKNKLAREEIYFMKDYICTRLLDKAQAAQDPLCEGMGQGG